MKVAAVQFCPVRGDVSRNLALALSYVRQAAALGAEMVVLPEMCTTGYIFADAHAIRPVCETREGRTLTAFQAEAQKHGITVCFGWAEKDDKSDFLYNSAAVCLPNGVTHFYRKNLLYDSDETWAEPGSTPYPVWSSRDGYICSLGICMDLNDDRFIEHLMTSQTRVLAFPTNWLEQGFQVWNYWAWRLAGSRACLVAANRFGTEDGITFCGSSAILDGCTLLASTEREGNDLVMASITAEPWASFAQD